MADLRGIWGWAGILIALAGGFFIYTCDKYDPSHLQVGTCSPPTADHRVVFGSHGSLTKEAERIRASNNEESADYTKKWETTITTWFTPKKACTTGESLEAEARQALHFSTTLSAGVFDDFEASMETQQAALLAERPVGPGGECYAFKGVEDVWYSMEALAVANTQSASSRFNQGVACVVVGLAVAAATALFSGAATSSAKKNQ